MWGYALIPLLFIGIFDDNLNPEKDGKTVRLPGNTVNYVENWQKMFKSQQTANQRKLTKEEFLLK